MRIATWNVERLKHKNRLDAILSESEKARADILVLTETDSRIMPEYSGSFTTSSLSDVTEPVIYANTENRVTIFTDYKCIRQYPTYDDNTAVCVELETPSGILIVYGTIIGISGNKRKDYNENLDRQLNDIGNLVSEGHNVCMIGDYNCSFCDNFYFTNAGREAILKCFGDNGISILTADMTRCIDHIAVSDSFMRGMKVGSIEEWNLDCCLSDHKGIAVEI